MNDDTYGKYGRIVTAMAFLTAVAIGVMQGIRWHLDGNPQVLPFIPMELNKRNPSIYQNFRKGGERSEVKYKMKGRGNEKQEKISNLVIGLSFSSCISFNSFSGTG